MEGATRQEVENAAKMANAHDFIMNLPKKYETMLGEKGTQISGGQKQRIAIARALIRNPKILLLDEATSALDAASERVVQSALDRASTGRTTVVVTHKLASIKNANRIIVMSEGKIVEEGTHDELMALKGHYFNLSEIQTKTQPDVPLNVKIDEPETVTKQRITTGIPGRFSVVSLPDKNLVSEDEGEIIDDEEVRPAPLGRIMKYNKPEWFLMFIGSISTLIVGGSLPLVAVTFGELYGVLSDPDPDVVMGVASFYSGMFLLIGIFVGIATFLQTYTFNKAGVELTLRMRVAAFSSILKQESGWFDDEKHRSGVLCARLSGDASNIQGATGSRISVILQSFSTLLIGAAMSFFYTWKMTLVTITTVPVVFFGIFLESKAIQGQGLTEKKSIEKATKVATEAIINIKTVASLGREQSMLDLYDKELLLGEKAMHIKSLMRGFAFALGHAAPCVCYAVSLWYGGILVANDGLHYKDVIKVSEALLYGAWVLGQSLAFAPNFTKAKISAARIFQLLDRTTKTSSGSVLKDQDWKSEGQVSLSEVKFSYPTRPEVEVLKGLNLDIQKGLSIALVGQSGCGKSTVIQLLQKLYDPTHGNIHIDEYDISDLEVSVLRKQFGLVSQEPVLFDKTIAENIAYGDNSRTVSHPEIIAAAKSANIHEFISCLPLGYETRLGMGGAQLSGGQKQRIAIARALVRNPRILLLDEATSALDAANESVIQAALDSASEGRTTITIGHRLQAVMRADVVYFLDQGQIVESGTHDELLRASGRYAEMLLQHSTN
ncbi:UNVERIFIED_CONTAM: hypothetical protein PYX00_005933 [Menopon gallinae]|uniref:ABC-type xenobiotic transporter n=1 Tax=Menopon gallinae TaxID=328185 RepID=A0AAW2HTY8_9NEOP